MNNEYPRIVSVDRGHPVGNLVAEYGDRMYWLGFGHGYITGALSMVAACFLGFYARGLRFRNT